MGDLDVAFELAISLSLGRYLVRHLRETGQELFRWQLVETWFHTLEKDLVDILRYSAPAGADLEDPLSSSVLDIQLCKRITVNERLKPEITVGIVQLEEDVSLGKRSLADILRMRQASCSG